MPPTENFALRAIPRPGPRRGVQGHCRGCPMAVEAILWRLWPPLVRNFLPGLPLRGCRPSAPSLCGGFFEPAPLRRGGCPDAERLHRIRELGVTHDGPRGYSCLPCDGFCCTARGVTVAHRCILLQILRLLLLPAVVEFPAQQRRLVRVERGATQPRVTLALGCPLARVGAARSKYHFDTLISLPARPRGSR